MGKNRLILGITFSVIGILAIIIGIIQYFAIKNAITNTLIEGLTVSSPESSGFASFQAQDPNKDNGLFYKCYFWNLTNVPQVLNGTKPQFTNVGPYTYRRRSNKFEINFSSDGTQVTYKEFGTYTYEPTYSAPGADPMNDKITNVNPAYWGILGQAGGRESALYVNGISQAMAEIRANVIGTNCATCFAPAIAIGSGGTFFASALPSIISGVYAEMLAVNNETTLEDARNAVWNDFANSTTPTYTSIPSWFLLSFGRASLASVSTLTRTQIETILLNPNVSFSIAAADGTSLSTLIELYTNAVPLQAVLPLIQNSFQLDGNATEYFISWRIGANFNAVVKASTVSYWNSQGFTLTSFDDDIGALHWGSVDTGALNGISLKDVTPSLPGIPEFLIWTKRNGYSTSTIPVADIKNALNLLTNTSKVLDLFSRFSVNPSTTPFAFLGFMQFNLIYYLGLNIIPNFVKPVFDQQFRGTVFVTASPYEQLFGRVDQLLLSLSPANANVSGVFTDFSQELSAKKPAETYTTGKNDPTMAGYRLTYNGSSILPFYTPPQPVQGSGDLAWVGPRSLNVAKPRDLSLFVSQVARDIVLTYLEDNEVKDIPTKRYTVSRQTPSLLQSTVWNNPANYLLNLNPVYGIPIFFSLPAFLEADPNTTVNLIEGVVADPETHGIFFDFEPISGLAIRGYAPLQGSLYVNSSSFNGPNAGIAANRYYPLYWILRFAEINDKDADSLRSRVVNTSESIASALIVLVVLGGLLLIAGLIFIGLYIASKKSEGTTQDVELN